MSLIGTTVRGIKLPLIKRGNYTIDELVTLIYNHVCRAADEEERCILDGDIIGITESLVARALDNYVTVTDIANSVLELFGPDADIALLYPIYSRNRFSLILKGIARAARKVIIQFTDSDEVGNKLINQVTGVNIIEFYKDIVESENAEFEYCISYDTFKLTDNYSNIILGSIHDRNFLDATLKTYKITAFDLTNLCNDPNENHGYNEEYGLLGSNKAGDELLKLFPRIDQCRYIVDKLKSHIKEEDEVDVEVLIYGDGCYKDFYSKIWELADPTPAPAYTRKLAESPNEVKLKYLIDNDIDPKSEIKLKDKSMGTTPRQYYSLLASLCDLTSGSGDKGTPVIWIQNYFSNYFDE